MDKQYTTSVYNQYKTSDFAISSDNLNPLRELSPEAIKNLEEMQKQLYIKYKEKIQAYFENPYIDENRVESPEELGVMFENRTKIKVRPAIYNGNGELHRGIVQEMGQRLGFDVISVINANKADVGILDLLRALPPDSDVLGVIKELMCQRWSAWPFIVGISSIPSNPTVLDLLNILLQEGNLDSSVTQLLRDLPPEQGVFALLMHLFGVDPQTDLDEIFKSGIEKEGVIGVLKRAFVATGIPDLLDVFVVCNLLSNTPPSTSLDDFLHSLPDSIDMKALLNEFLLNVEHEVVVSVPSIGGKTPALSIVSTPLTDLEVLTLQLNNLLDSLLGEDYPLTLDDLPFDICQDRGDILSQRTESLIALSQQDQAGSAGRVDDAAKEETSDLKCILIELQILQVILAILNFLKTILKIERVFLAVVYPIIEMIIRIIEAIFNPSKRIRLVLDLAGQIFSIIIAWLRDYVMELLGSLDLNCLVTSSQAAVSEIMGTIRSVKDVGSEWQSFANFQTTQIRSAQIVTERVEKLTDTPWDQRLQEQDAERMKTTQKVVKDYFKGKFSSF